MTKNSQKISRCNRLRDTIFSNKRPWELYKKPKNHALIESYLRLAEQNLESSRALRNINNYPDSIFLLQQAVEKIVKSYALSIGLLNEFTVKDVSHDIFCIFYIMQEIEEKYAENQTNNDLSHYIPILNEQAKDRLKKVREVRTHLKKHRNISDWYLPHDDVSEIIAEMNSLRVDWISIYRKIEERKVLMSISIDLFVNLGEMLEAINMDYENFLKYADEYNMKLPQGVITKADFEDMLKSLKNVSDDEKKNMAESIKNLFSKAFDSTPDMILRSILRIRLTNLATIVSSHVVSSRYPEPKKWSKNMDHNVDFDPLIFYNESLPLIDKYDEISHHVELCINDLKYLCKNIDLAGNPGECKIYG